MKRASAATAVLLLIAAALLCASTPARADDAADSEREYQELKNKIESNEKQLNIYKGVESSTLDDIEKANRELSAISRELRKYRSTLTDTGQRIEGVKADISALGGKLNQRKDWLRLKVRAMSRYGKYADLLLTLEGSSDMAQFMRRWHYLNVLAALERRAIEGYRHDLTTLHSRQDELSSLYSRLQGDEHKVAGAERLMAEKKKDKEGMLADVRRKKASQEQMLREMRDAQQRLLEMIKKTERTTEQYTGKGFGTRKGSLQWPVRGSVAAGYGTGNDPRLNTPVFRNGIYITSAEGSVVYSVHSGKVVFADWFKGYGQLVIIDHGEGYHSLYGNLSEIFLKTGDIIEGRTKIGVVGDSGLFNKPSLYFEIRYKGKPLDPMQWLGR